MISAIEWVPQGAADPNPKRYELSKAEMEMLEAQADMDADLAEGGEDDSSDDGSNADGANGADGSSKIQLEPVDMSTLPADLRMDEYSDDEDDEAKAGGRVGNLLIGKETELMGTHLDEDGMPVEDIDEDDEDEEGGKDGNNSDDDDDDDDLADVPDTREFMPVDVEGLEAMGLSAAGLGGALNEEDDDDDASDLEDTNLRPDDAMVVVAKTEEDFASLEVHVYEQKTGNLFVHHDIPLPSFPLCLAHGDINPDGGAGNYVAVGTFNTGIEIWNLDVLLALEPVCILGGEDTSAADELMRINMARAASGKKLKKKAGSMSGGLRPGSHTDAVMALSWNKVHRQVLASGSADKTVKVRICIHGNFSSSSSSPPQQKNIFHPLYLNDYPNNLISNLFIYRYGTSRKQEPPTPVLRHSFITRIRSSLCRGIRPRERSWPQDRSIVLLPSSMQDPMTARISARHLFQPIVRPLCGIPISPSTFPPPARMAPLPAGTFESSKRSFGHSWRTSTEV